MSVGGVQSYQIHLRLHKSRDPVQHVGCSPDGRAAQQAAALVPGGVGIAHGLFDVLDGDKALQAHLVIHQGELLDTVPAQYLLGFLQGGAHCGGDKVILGHNIFYRLVEVVAFHKAHVAVGDDAHQYAVLADGHAGDLEAAHQLFSLADEAVRGQEEGVRYNAVLRALYAVNLIGLLLDGHVLVDDADAALTGYGYGHIRLRNGVHGGGEYRGVETDSLGKLGGEVRFAGQHMGFGGDQQHIVKGQALF